MAFLKSLEKQEKVDLLRTIGSANNQSRTEEIKMEYKPVEPWQAIDINGVVYDQDSLYDYFNRMVDPRKDRGKRYRLVVLLMFIFLAKMGLADTPSAIADWVKARRKQMLEMLG